jgi:tripartite-type tricarboxylate transporter receptor subunit TctC
MKALLRWLLPLTVLVAPTLPVQAQDWPSRPISMVVGFSAGGSADIVGRILAQQLSGPLGQQVVVENRPGAGGTIAAAQVAQAASDGYSMLLVTSGHAGSGALYPKLPFDPTTSFSPVALVASTPVVIVVRADSPYRTLADVLTAARKQPGKLNYAAGGGGATTTNLAAEFLKEQAGVKMEFIAYKGSAPALTGLIGGEIDLAFDIPSSALPHIKAGKLRALAVTGQRRAPVLADVPTVAESGIAGFDVVGWFGVMVPAGTPAAIVTRLNQEINKALASGPMQERMQALVLDAEPGSPDSFAKVLARDTRRFGDAIRRMDLKVN